MKRFALLFICLFWTHNVIAGEWSYELEFDAQALYGWSNIKKHNHGIGKTNLSSAVIYDFDGNNLSLNFNLNGGIDREMHSYNQGRWGEEVYGVFDSRAGQIMLGQVYNVAYLFHNSAPNTGAVKNNFDVVDFIANPNWKRNSKETYFATLPSTEINTDGVAAKFNYISPEFFGTAIGFSYTPDAYNRRGLINKHAKYAHKNGFAGAVYNDFDWGMFKTQASFGYAQYHENDKEFSYSLRINKGNWILGGGFHKTYVDGENNAHPDHFMRIGFDDYREGSAWNVGIGHEFGPISSALTYFESESSISDNENKIVVFSTQLQLNKNVNVFVASSYVDFNGNDDKKSGYAFVAGAGVYF